MYLDDYSLLIPYDLQFFGDDKTEEPTSKKIDDTRSKGQVGKSQELTHAASLIVLFVLLMVFGGNLAEGFLGMFNWSYDRLIPDIIATERSGLTLNTSMGLFSEVSTQMFFMTAPFLLIGFVVAALVTAIQFKFKISTEPLKPKLSKINPASGFKRIFSAQSLFNLGLSIVKLALIFIIAYVTISDHLMELYLMYELDVRSAVSLVVDIILNTGLRISFVYLVVGIADFAYQKYKFKKDIKMTKQEVKDEYKDAEGDPQIKGQIKQRMREASNRRMMSAVPQADVVITNPTHIAVALKYDAEVANAPILVAKGEQFMAQRIKDVAKESNVPVIENKPLARMLFTTVDVGEQIPPELYTAVAEILALIFTRRAGANA